MWGGLYEACRDMEEIEKDKKHRRRVKAIILMAVVLALTAGIVLCIVLL